MTAPISVVIPTWMAADRIGPCLGALADSVLEGLIREVILVDGGSDDGIDQVAEAVGARLIIAPRGRGTQMAAGAAGARGEWLLFLHADTVLAPGWGRAVADHLTRSPGRAAYFRLAFDARGLAPALVAGWANLRSSVFALPYGDQGLLIARGVYDAAGGHPAWPLMEDVALVRALGRARLTGLRHVAVTSADRYVADGWLRRGARNLGTLALYALGRSPERLAARHAPRR